MKLPIKADPKPEPVTSVVELLNKILLQMEANHQEQMEAIAAIPMGANGPAGAQGKQGATGEQGPRGKGIFG